MYVSVGSDVSLVVNGRSTGEKEEEVEEAAEAMDGCPVLLKERDVDVDNKLLLSLLLLLLL